MDAVKKKGRYQRIHAQLSDLLESSTDPIARMSTIAAILHHKLDYFFWVGFYLLVDGELVVGPYQGPVACMVLEKHKGVCWAGIDSGKAVIVPDVHDFPGHIACDSRSKSEIVIPLFDESGGIRGVLDVDSDKLSSFDEVDLEYLQMITSLVYA